MSSMPEERVLKGINEKYCEVSYQARIPMLLYQSNNGIALFCSNESTTLKRKEYYVLYKVHESFFQ